MYVILCTPNIAEEKLMLEQISSRSATNSTYINRFVQRESVTAENNWTLELRVEKVLDVPFDVEVGLIFRVQFQQGTLNSDNFYQPCVSNAHCI